MTKRSDGIGRWAKKWPIATFLGAGLAIVIATVPALAQSAQFQVIQWTDEPLRILSSHFAHFSTRHLLYDLIVFIGLGLACELRWPSRTRWTLLFSAALIPLVFLCTTEHLQTYRGLSGLGSALLMLLAGRLHRERAFDSKLTRHLPLITCVGFIGKVLFELNTGQAVFVDEGAIFEPVPIAHLTGGLIGLLAAFSPERRTTCPRRCGGRVCGSRRPYNPPHPSTQGQPKPPKAQDLQHSLK